MFLYAIKDFYKSLNINVSMIPTLRAHKYEAGDESNDKIRYEEPSKEAFVEIHDAI